MNIHTRKKALQILIKQVKKRKPMIYLKEAFKNEIEHKSEWEKTFNK